MWQRNAVATAARVATQVLLRGVRTHPLARAVLLGLDVWRAYTMLSRLDDQPFARNWSGHTLTWTCTPGPLTSSSPGRRISWGVAFPDACYYVQAGPANDPMAPLTGGELTQGFMLMGQRSDWAPPNIRWDTLEIWRTTGVPDPNPWQWIGPEPLVHPAIDPFLNTPFSREPRAVVPSLNIVRARPDSEAPGYEQSERGPLVRPAPEGPPVRWMIPFPFVATRSNPMAAWKMQLGEAKRRRSWPLNRWRVEDGPRIADLPGEVRIYALPRGRVAARLVPSRHRKVRPRSGTRELKVVVTASKMAATKVAGTTSEALDAISAIYAALPLKVRMAEWKKRHGKDPTHARKLELIEEHWDVLDQRAAVRNLFEEQFNDWFVGQLGQSAQKRLVQSGWHKPTGIEHGNTLGGGQGWKPEGTPTPQGKSGQQQLAEYLSDLLVPEQVAFDALSPVVRGLRAFAGRAPRVVKRDVY